MARAAVLAETAGVGRLEPLEPANLATQVADHLVEAIAAGRFTSGQRLIEAEVAAELGISRIPVREAMRELESQGLIVSRPHRGIRLIEFDMNWAQQLYETRVAIERVSWRHAATLFRHEPERLAGLDRPLERMRAAVAAGDRRAVNQAHIAFHEALCEESDSPLMMTLWRTVRRHARIIFDHEVFRMDDLSEVFDQHVRLRRLLIAGSDAALERELKSHVLGWLSLKERGSGESRRRKKR